jgi:hypothetical protein
MLTNEQGAVLKPLAGRGGRLQSCRRAVTMGGRLGPLVTPERREVTLAA